MWFLKAKQKRCPKAAVLGGKRPEMGKIWVHGGAERRCDYERGENKKQKKKGQIDVFHPKKTGVVVVVVSAAVTERRTLPKSACLMGLWTESERFCTDPRALVAGFGTFTTKITKKIPKKKGVFGPKWWKIEARGGVGFGLKRPEMANGGTASVWGRRQEKHQNDGFSPQNGGVGRQVGGGGGGGEVIIAGVGFIFG